MEGKGKRCFRDMVRDFVEENDVGVWCKLSGENSTCKHFQTKYDAGNFVRHFRGQHFALAKEKGFFKDGEEVEPRPKKLKKIPVETSEQIIVDSCVKLVAVRNMPLSSIDWPEMRAILDPLASGLGTSFSSVKTKKYINIAAAKIQKNIALEMKGKLISLKIDSASRHGRHILGINAQFVNEDQIVIRTLGMVELKDKQTGKFLKSKILEILQKYNVGIQNVFSITCDNGANMCAAVKQLQTYFELQKLEELDESMETDDDGVLEHIMNEFKDSVNLIRCAVHTLQLAVTDVTKRFENEISNVTTVAKNCRKIAYKIYFDKDGQALPPLYAKTRWGGAFKMLEHFKSSEEFYTTLGAEHGELDLTDSWEFIDSFVQAFRPAYDCTISMQDKHVGLSDFYMQWLNTTRKVYAVQNDMAKLLCDTLTERLNNLKKNMPFRAAILLDPRFNFLNSTLFTPDDKEEIRRFIINTSARISVLNEAEPGSQQAAMTEASSSHQDDFDNFLTSMFGGSLAGSSQSAECSQKNTLAEQLSMLDAGLRQPHHIDVWNYWLQKKTTHKDLFQVAAVVYAVPSTQVSVERAFSALALTLSDHRTSLGEHTLEDLLIVKLNPTVLEKILPELTTD